MSSERKRLATIIDYGICNMFSVKHACERVGFVTEITSSIPKILKADVAILPGVGAFGEGISALRRLDLIEPIKDFARSKKPLIGICLGFQMLFTESQEFGAHKGLDVLQGMIRRFESKPGSQTLLRVPHVGWNQITRPDTVQWDATPLGNITSGSFAYFCHSYYADPADSESWLAATQYGDFRFASAVRKDNIFAFQFHPEKSGFMGKYMFQKIFQLTE